MSSLKTEVRNYILNRRTISFANVCGNFEQSPESLIDYIKEMEENKDIRINNSACTLDCSSCSSCGEKEERIKTTSILISLKRLF